MRINRIQELKQNNTLLKSINFLKYITHWIINKNIIMTKKLAIISLFCLAAIVLVAQKKQSPTKDSIIFKELIYDYGTIEVGSPGNSEFIFTNTMKKPLVISNVKPSCGCTIANWTKGPILPGKTGVIKLDYNTKIPGTFNKTIVVSSNAKNKTVILTIKGNVNRYR